MSATDKERVYRLSNEGMKLVADSRIFDELAQTFVAEGFDNSDASEYHGIAVLLDDLTTKKKTFTMADLIHKVSEDDVEEEDEVDYLGKVFPFIELTRR